MTMQSLSRAACVVAICLVLPGSAMAQIRVNPTGVNVNTQGATTVFLTYGGLTGYDAVEALWCGELVDARPAAGLRCDPGTIFGSLPLRFNQAGASGTNALTDIMTIPASVTRRAYQSASDGQRSAFFYVRRFVSRTGGQEQYVAVTCRLAGGGARTPLALTDVQLDVAGDRTPIMTVAQGEVVPSFEARVAYTGTGRLIGRWEVVLPGEELPTADDLLTEATLPRERRGSQRRYTQLSRFNVFLPPTGRVVLPGPDPGRLPSDMDGVYYVLLRVEASADKEGDSNLASVGAGAGVVNSGGVAGFPMPTLRYVVGSGTAVSLPASTTRDRVLLLVPRSDAQLDRNDPLSFAWASSAQVAMYRLELETAAGAHLFSALIAAPLASYRMPPLLTQRLNDATAVRWRVVATDAIGREIARSAWRNAGVRQP